MVGPDSSSRPARQSRSPPAATRQPDGTQVAAGNRTGTTESGRRDRRNSPHDRALQSSLPPDSALIDFLEISRSTPPKEPTGKIEFTRELLAFVVKADAPPEMVPLGPVEPLAQAVETWRQSHGMSPAAREAGTLLRKSLWEPLLRRWARSKRFLFPRME